MEISQRDRLSFCRTRKAYEMIVNDQKIHANNYLFLILFFFLCTACNFRTEDVSDKSTLDLQFAKNKMTEGGKLFNANCAKCHFICQQGIGPALAGVTKRRDRQWLVSFIKNSQKVIGSGDEYAQHLFHNFNNAVMPDFDNLSDEDISKILTFIDQQTIDSYEEPDVNKNYSTQNIEINTSEKDKVNYYQQTTDLKFTGEMTHVLKGKQLFNNNCRECHEICAEKIGPPLASVTYRRPLPWLIDFIKDPKNVLETGDNYALYISAQYHEVMTANYLDDDEIMNILSYIRHESGSPGHIAGVNSPESLSDPKEIFEPTDKVETDIDPIKYDPPEEPSMVAHVALIVVVVATVGIFLFFLIRISRKLET